MLSKMITKLDSVYKKALKARLDAKTVKQLETMKYMIKAILKEDNKKIKKCFYCKEEIESGTMCALCEDDVL